MTARSDAPELRRPKEAHPRTRTAAGIGLTILAIGLFTVMDTIGKSLTARYPVPQVVWARYFFQFSWMLLLIPRIGATGLVRTRRLGMNIVRGLLLAVSTLFMFTAISFVPLADAYTITFTAPCWSRYSRSHSWASGSAGGAGAPCLLALRVC